MTVFHIAIVPPKAALPGQRIASRQGTLTPSIAQTRALTGQAITSAKGTVAFSKSGLPLTGQTITSRQGAVAASAVSTLSVALTGQVITSAKGSLTASRPLTGLRITSIQGGPAPRRALALFGKQITARIGRVTNLQILNTSLPNATVGVAYNAQINATGGIPPYVYQEFVSPNTGGWLTINGATGAMTGTPGTAETESVQITVQDSVTSFVIANFSIAVQPAAGQVFPRVGAYLIAGSVQTSFGTTAFQQSVATTSVAVIGLLPNWTSGGFNLNSAAAAVHAINPNCKIFPYTNIMELEPGVGASGSSYSPIFNAATTGNWFTRNPWPAGPIVDVDGLSQQGLNCTTFTTGLVGGQTYLDWRAAWTTANEFATNWNGVYLDNVSQGNNFAGNVDFRQVGTSVAANSTTAKQDFRNGYASYLPKLKAALPAGKLVIGNVADWGNSPITGYPGILDGGVMEHAIGPSFSYEAQGWTTLKNYYALVMNSVNAPKYVVFVQDAAATNYAGMRYGLCTCLLDNAYYANSANGGYGSITLLDEFNFNLGAPIAGPNNAANGTISSGGLTVWSNGIWRRDFANGIILVNPRGNLAKTNIALGGTFWHLRASTYANQDPTINNAAQVTTVNMPDPGTAGTGGSGLFLSRTVT
jgi:hypothetical protein